MANVLSRRQIPQNVIGKYRLTVTECSQPDVALDNVFPTAIHPRYETMEGRDGQFTVDITVNRELAEMPEALRRLQKALFDAGFALS